MSHFSRIATLVAAIVSIAALPAFGQHEPFMKLLRQSPGKVVPVDGAAAEQSLLKLTGQWTGDCYKARITNAGTNAARVHEVVLFDVSHDLPGKTRFYGEGFTMLSQTDGTLARMHDIDALTDRKHYRIPEPAGFRAVYGMMMLGPAKSPQLLLGFTSCRRFVGKFYVSPSRIQVVVDTENLVLRPGETWDLEEFQVLAGSSRDALLGRFGDRIGQNHPRLARAPVPTGWCSWYCFGSEVTAKNVFDNVAFIAKNVPQLRYIQIDDGYEPHMGDWLDSGSSFGGKIQDVLAEIRRRGFEPAIWVAPFIADGQSRVFKEHPDWFVTDADGKPLSSDKTTFGGWRFGPWYALDGTHPEAQRHLENVFRTMRTQWGCTYFKLDANFWGAIHGGRFHDPQATRVEAYRRGMAAVRRGAGNAFLLGCNHPLWPSLGMIHGSRSSMDTDRSWNAFSNIGRENLFRNWQNGRLWWNDPDCVLLMGDLPQREFMFHATLIYTSGGMLLSGDDLTKVSPERLVVLKKLMPPTGKPAQFADDSFAEGAVKLDGRTMVAVFNWTDQPEKRRVPLVRKSHVKDYWSGEDLGIQEKAIDLGILPGRSARLLEIRPAP
jgi:alpha-galactosidase